MTRSLCPDEPFKFPEEEHMSKALTVFVLVPGKGEGQDRKTYFNRAGVAFENRDGSINVKLDVLPTVTFQIRDQPANGNGSTDSTQPKPDKPF
jgi:hypothetical protein